RATKEDRRVVDVERGEARVNRSSRFPIKTARGIEAVLLQASRQLSETGLAIGCEIHLLDCRDNRPGGARFDADDENCLALLAGDRKLVPAPHRLQPRWRQHNQQRLAAPQLLIEALLPIHTGRDAVGGIKVQEKLLVPQAPKPVLERSSLGVVRA